MSESEPKPQPQCSDAPSLQPEPEQEPLPKLTPIEQCGDTRCQLPGGQWGSRSVAAAVVIVILPVLIVAAWLSPDTRGYDTHTALGLPPCEFPLRWGLPCPACGMTTAFANILHGHIFAAFKAQIFGAILAVYCIVIVGVATIQLISGRDMLTRLTPRKSWILPLAAAVVLAWAIKAIQMSSAG